MKNKTRIVVSGLVMLASTTIAVGDNAGVRIVTRYSAGMDTGVMTYPVNTDATHVIRVVRRPVADPSAMVSRELYEQPVYGHLVEVNVDQQTIYLDPHEDYVRDNGETQLPPNFVTEAINEHIYQEGKKHRIIRRAGAVARNDQIAGRGRIVIFRPGGQKDGPGMRMMPSVPNNPKSKNRDLMVATENEVLPSS